MKKSSKQRPGSQAAANGLGRSSTNKRAAGQRNNSRQLKALVATLREHLPDLQARYGVKCLSLFGSFVRGDEKRGSDLDVLVEFEPDHMVTLLDFVRLENELSDLLGVKVDLVERAGLKPRISERVLEEAIAV